MKTMTTPKAVGVATAHIEAWSNHQWEKAQTYLDKDVRVQVSTTQPIMQDVDTIGVDKYMEGLKLFAQGVVPGSAKIIASVGDDSTAMITSTVKANFGPGEVLLTGSRLYSIDEHGLIKSEKVIFFVMQQ